MYSDIVRQPKSGFLEHVAGEAYADIGEQTEEDIAVSQSHGETSGVYGKWLLLAVIVGLWSAAGVLWMWGTATVLGAAVVAGACCRSIRERGWEGVRKVAAAGVEREVRRFENLQGKIALQLYEIRHTADWLPLHPSHISDLQEQLSSEVSSLRLDIESRLSPLIAFPHTETRIHQIQAIRLYTRLLTRNNHTAIILLARLWYSMMCRCLRLESVYEELGNALNSAYLLMTQEPNSVEGGSSFETGEMRKVHGLTLHLVATSKRLYEAVATQDWQRAVETYNHYSDSLENLLEQHRISAHYLLQLLGDRRYAVYNDRLLPAREVPSEAVPTPEVQAVPSTPSIPLDDNSSEDSDTAYVYEGTADTQQSQQSVAPVDLRTYRLSQRTLSELRERMKQRPQAKVKLVTVGSEHAPEVPLAVSHCPDTTTSPDVKSSARRLFAEMISTANRPPAAEVLEG